MFYLASDRKSQHQSEQSQCVKSDHSLYFKKTLCVNKLYPYVCRRKGEMEIRIKVCELTLTPYFT